MVPKGAYVLMLKKGSGGLEQAWVGCMTIIIAKSICLYDSVCGLVRVPVGSLAIITWLIKTEEFTVTQIQEG